MAAQQIADQISEAISNYDLPPRSHVVSTERSLEWIRYCGPRDEDTIDGVPFVSSEALNICIFRAPNNTYLPSDVPDHNHVQRIIKTFYLFPRYKVVCFLEVGTAAETDEENDNTDATDALLEYEPKLAGICEAMKDYGFKYIGRIDKRTGVGQDIIDVIDQFLNPNG